LIRDFSYIVFRRIDNMFFFQAEDGIRDFHVTGVQTCALPILLERSGYKLVTAESCTGGLVGRMITDVSGSSLVYDGGWVTYANRSEERRVGKEGRARRTAQQKEQQKK